MTRLADKAKAARVYQETGNVSEAARQTGVNRATIHRWMKDPGFLNVASLPVEEAEPEGTIGLKLLIPKAMQLLDDALEGKKVTQGQLRAAMEVVRASNALKETQRKGESLAERIAALDEAEGGQDGD
jgi:hypothetical protein